MITIYEKATGNLVASIGDDNIIIYDDYDIIEGECNFKDMGNGRVNPVVDTKIIDFKRG